MTDCKITSNSNGRTILCKLGRGVYWLLLAVTLSACVSSTRDGDEAKDPEYQLVWPSPPDAPRFVFEAQLRNETDIEKVSEELRMQRLLTGRERSSAEPVYRKPSAVAARKGRVYVADPPNKSIVVFDVPRGKIYRMGVREPNQMESPISLAVDAEGRVYALDAALKKVMVFDPLGLFLFSVGNKSALTKPAGVAVSPDGRRIYVVDRGSVENDDHKVIVYSPDGTELHRLGPRGSGPGEVNIPLDAAVSRDGKVHILDSGNFRVQVFDESGKFLSQFGSVGSGFGQFSRPRRITTDAGGNIYVSDASFNNVQIFSPAGELLMWLGRSGQQNLPGQFALIGAVAIDETGRLYVADQYYPKIEVYRPADGATAAPTRQN